MLYEQLKELKILSKPLVTKTACEVVRLKYDALTFTNHPYGRRVKYWINCDNNTRLLFKILDTSSCVGEIVSAEIASQLSISCIDPIICDLEYADEEKDKNSQPHSISRGIAMTDFRNLKNRDKYLYYNVQQLANKLKIYNFDQNVTVYECIELLNRLKASCFNDKMKNTDGFEIGDKLVENLYKLVIFDYLTYQKDRYCCNIGFVISKDEDGLHTINLAPLYDNEDSFDLKERFLKNDTFKANADINSMFGQGSLDKFIGRGYNKPSLLKIRQRSECFENYLSEIAEAIRENPNLEDFWNSVKDIEINKLIKTVEKKNSFRIASEMKSKVLHLFEYRRKILEKEIQNQKHSNSEQIV